MFAPESITSPDSFVAPSRESTKTTLLIASSSSSRQSGRHAPTALTWQPGFSHNPFSTGVFEFVRSDNHICTADCLLNRRCCRANFLRESLRMFLRRTPNTNLFKVSNQAQSFHVTMRLHTAAENRQHFRVGRCEKLRRCRGYCRGAHLRNQSPVHYCQRRTRFRIDKKNCGHMCRDSALCIRRIERDGF